MDNLFDPDYAVPPGTTLQAFGEINQISPHQLAARLCMTHDDYEELEAGDTRIDSDMAEKLERATRVPADFWLRRETEYRQRLAELRYRGLEGV